MDLKQILARGAIVNAELVKVPVKWVHTDAESGEEVTDEFTVHVVRQSFGQIERLWNTPDDRSRGAQLIAEQIRFGENGTEQLTYEQAYALDPGLATELLAAHNSVNTQRRRPKS